MHGRVNISVQFTPVTALPDIDYRTVVRFVVFENGQNMAYVDVQLFDDVIPERQETFIIHLRSVVQGKAPLSNVTMLTVTIETSDNPNGLIGLFNVSDYVMQNPLSNKEMQFQIQRMDGNVGAIQVGCVKELRIKKSIILQGEQFFRCPR